MARRRMVVAFVEVENAQDRMWRHVASNMSVDAILAEPRRPMPKPFHDGGHTPEGRLVYWCAADKPRESDDFKVAPVHRTSWVFEGAECEECGIDIRHLQAELTRALRPLRG